MKPGLAHAAIAVVLTLLVGVPARADPYVEVFGGMAVFDSTVTVGGVKLVDQGGDAPLYGVRAGYGRRWPSGLYLGAEADLWGGHGRSRAVVHGVGYSFDLRGGAGAYARVGWSPGDGRALFYGRAGVQMIDTSMGTRTAAAFGAGAEIPFAGRWYVRADLTYALDGVEIYQGTVGIGRRF